MRYYGQNGEDFLLWSLFTPGDAGFFVDVGAFDGVHTSNTLSFAQQGWTGLCIEPHPGYYPLLVRNRPESVCLQTACVGDPTLTEATMLIEPLGLFSGFHVNANPNMQGYYRARSMEYPGLTEYVAPAATLDALLREHAPQRDRIDVLSLDVEGAEPDVMNGLTLPARVVAAEANTPEAAEKLQSVMTAKGYLFARQLMWNYFFTATAEDQKIIARAKGTIHTEQTTHPLGAVDPNERIGREITFAPQS